MNVVSPDGSLALRSSDNVPAPTAYVQVREFEQLIRNTDSFRFSFAPGNSLRDDDYNAASRNTQGQSCQPIPAFERVCSLAPRWTADPSLNLRSRGAAGAADGLVAAGDTVYLFGSACLDAASAR